MREESAESKRPYRGALPEERRAQRRGQLIAAAIEVYGDRGYRRSSVKSVCEAAGLTERYFYESFANSDELLVAAYNEVTARVRAALRKAAEAAGRGRNARARAMLHTYFGILRNDERLARLFLVEIRGVSAQVDAAIDASLQDIGDDVFGALAPAGAAADPLLQAGLIGGVLHIALRWIADEYRCPVDKVVDAAMRLGAALTGRGAACRSGMNQSYRRADEKQ